MKIQRHIVAFLGSLLLTEMFMIKVILPIYKFNGFFMGHTLIFYMTFLIIYTSLKFIFKIDQRSQMLELERLEKEYEEYLKNEKLNDDE